MRDEAYAPGHSEEALAFMRIRSGESHAAYFLPLIPSGGRVLDLGCGPGTITVDLAAAAAPGGEVVGVDIQAEQLEEARRLAAARAMADTTTFMVTDVYSLPFDDGSFDAAFSNALFEHVADPVAGMREIRRVLRPGAPLGVSIPDWERDLILEPNGSGIDEVVERYTEIQARGGGNMRRGAALAGMLEDAGFADVTAGAHNEAFEPALIGGLLASLFEREDPGLAAVARDWIRDPAARFEQVWAEAIGRA